MGFGGGGFVNNPLSYFSASACCTYVLHLCEPRRSNYASMFLDAPKRARYNSSNQMYGYSNDDWRAPR